MYLLSACNEKINKQVFPLWGIESTDFCVQA